MKRIILAMTLSVLFSGFIGVLLGWFLPSVVSLPLSFVVGLCSGTISMIWALKDE